MVGKCRLGEHALGYDARKAFVTDAPILFIWPWRALSDMTVSSLHSRLQHSSFEDIYILYFVNESLLIPDRRRVGSLRVHESL